MQFKLLKIGITIQFTASSRVRDWVRDWAVLGWVAAGAFLGALLFVNPVFSYHGTGLDSTNDASSNGLVCTLGFANGGFGSGAGEEWIQLGTDGSQVRWGDFNGDGLTGDREEKTQDPETLKWKISYIFWKPITVCEVIDCDNPGDDDGGNTCVPGSPGCDDDGEPCEPGSPGCDGDGEPCEPGTPGCNEDDESCEPGSPGCEPAGNGGGNPGITSGGPPDSPPGCTNRRLTEYGMECQLTCPAYPVTGGGVACLDVIRQPYPRGMVTVPNYYTLNGPWINQGAGASCPDPDVEFPMVTNSSVRIDFRLRQDTPPAWRFDERPWNIVNHDATNEAYGMVVEHTFDTSSFSTFEGDKPYNGPSLTEELLSSYQVQVFTWWDGFVITRWDQWGWEISYETREVCDEFGVCSEQELEVSREYVYRGPQENTERVDLRTLGYPSSSMFSDLAWDSRQEPIFPYHCRVIPTPIIEVQSILVGP